LVNVNIRFSAAPVGLEQTKRWTRRRDHQRGSGSTRLDQIAASTASFRLEGFYRDRFHGTWGERDLYDWAWTAPRESKAFVGLDSSA
jgi:hypothetical protein